ncbi:MAG: GT4 family glycosyltransferase PelF [Gammaproteobacteria bacterium]
MTKPLVGLLLEGTYPFVQGGVSSWVHQLIRGLDKQYNFALTFIGSTPSDHPKQHYKLPENVLSLDCFYLFAPEADCRTDFGTQHAYHKKLSDPAHWGKPRRHRLRPHRTQRPSASGTRWFIDLIHRLQNPKTPMNQRLLQGFLANNGPIQHPFYPTDMHRYRFSQEHALSSTILWKLLTRDYERFCPTEPFNHFCWHYRGLYQQLFRIAHIAQRARPADMYHSISTGYAGFIGAILSAAGDRPLIITEHGIYTRERRIDLNDAPWLTSPRRTSCVFDRQHESVIRTLWIRFFEQLSHTAYHQASHITSLYAASRRLQINEGAAPEKTHVICNGIAHERFARQNHLVRATSTPRVALIGRVVSIKDVATFIKAISIVRLSHPTVQAEIVGPLDEQPEYVEQCHMLVDLLNLSNHVTFTGSQEVETLMPTLDVLALTSISEAQPLVLLEAMASGVPIVATDVGACREMIEGPDANAPAPCGLIVPIASAQASAQAISHLLANPALREQMGQCGRQRVQTHYAESSMLSAYHALYANARDSASHRARDTTTDTTRPEAEQWRIPFVHWGFPSTFFGIKPR